MTAAPPIRHRTDWRTWLLLAGAVVSEMTATLSLRGALDRSWLYVAVVAGYLASFALLAAVLRRGMPLGVAYGIWGATGVAVTALVAAAVFAEPLTLVTSLGLVLIIGGVLLVESGSRPTGAAASRTRDRRGTR